MTNDLLGKRVTVMGLGTRGGGVGVARYLAERGAVVTVTDLKPEYELTRQQAMLADLPVRFVLGRHDDADFTSAGADIVIRNPGVRRNSTYLNMARASGVRIEMEMSLFMRECAAPVIGVTGTKGKTTTASLCAAMLQEWRPDTVLAGNMGVSAVAELGRIQADTPVVLELSSWQLEALDEHKLSPRIAVLTNISEDHLDAYDGFADYAETKRSITKHQTDEDVLVVNADDHESAKAIGTTAALVVPVQRSDRVKDGIRVQGDLLVWRSGRDYHEFDVPDRFPFLGMHQRLNAAAAAGAALALGAPARAIQAGLNQFGGVRNRMEVVDEIDGVLFINDSAATAPIAAISNLTGLSGQRVHLISGGHDKQSDLTELARTIAHQAYTVQLLRGSATESLRRLLNDLGVSPPADHDSMQSAVLAAARIAVEGDVVLLSPGLASFGLFRDEFDRGDQFSRIGEVVQQRAGSNGMKLPEPPAGIHFVGIGGIGMSGLARILFEWGYRVTGSDGARSDQTDALVSTGIPVSVGHTDVLNAGNAALVVATAAVRAENPELKAATAAGVPVIKRAELLGMLANARTCVAVAGSHGKSTTSGMIASSLIELGAEPSYAVGAVLSTGVNAAPGAGEAMVVEADEYDYSFLTLEPDVAVITNIDYDHPDIFPTQQAYEDAFLAFANKMRPGGTLVLPDDDPIAMALGERLGGEFRGKLTTFGENDGAAWRLEFDGDRPLVITPSNQRVSLDLQVPGRHNARNATASLAALFALGHDAIPASRAVSAYSGIGRRFELKGDFDDIVVVDDYAHHPREIAATISAARSRYPRRRLVVAFQPHTFSRTKAMLGEFAAALGASDLPVVLDIYASRETDSLGVSSQDLLAHMDGRAVAGGDVSDAVGRVAEVAKPGDLIITMGAGDVTLLGPRLLERLSMSACCHD